MNENTPLVSIIVPCYNNGAYLAEAVDSVLSQAYSNWECVIVDDGSTDDSRQVAEKYVQKDPRFKYIYQESRGVACARNQAIKNSSGTYILPLDADDKISSAYLKEAIKVLEANKQVKLVYCKAHTFGVRSGPWKLPDYSYKHLLIENLIFCSAVFRRSAMQAKTGYDENMKEGFEDWEFWISFLSENDKVVQLPGEHFFYRLRENSHNPQINDHSKQKLIWEYIFNKHSNLYTQYYPLQELLFDYYRTKARLFSIQNSGSYRIGRSVLQPFWFVKRLFK